ncbi:hypothetical protein BKG96_08810 [Rodentibacter caecimuris]|uniref:Uncharacterized protein n=2 Tax=Rodentibacter caecimuris TaxID=1796644 RepID=A0A1V3KIZ9_9PAST|nr:hypothetical protein BKG96_08810 [Rodentibacter heylii]
MTNSPKYEISDENTKKWVLEGNKVEQCIFSKEWKAGNFNKLSDEERYLHQKYVYEMTLGQVISPNNIHLIGSDSASQVYLHQQFLKFNHGNKIEFDKNWCNNLKAQYKNELIQVKNYVKQQKAQALAQQKELKRQQAQAEKERKAREAYLRTPQGQAELAYQQQMLEQQRQYQQQMLAAQRQAAEQAAFQQLSNTINSGLQSVTQTIQRNTQLINQMNQNMRSSCQSIGNGWGTGSWTNVCY